MCLSLTEFYVKFRFEKGQKRNPSFANNFYIAKHRSIENTNIAHGRFWNHRNTASCGFIHRITALKIHQHRNNPCLPPDWNGAQRLLWVYHAFSLMHHILKIRRSVMTQATVKTRETTTNPFLINALVLFQFSMCLALNCTIILTFLFIFKNAWAI